MKARQKALISAILILAALLPVLVESREIHTDTTLFNVTITASGGGIIGTDDTNYSVVIGEPVVGNASTDTTQFRYGFFYSLSELAGFILTTNIPPGLPVWIYPTNGTQILDDPLVVMLYSAGDGDGDVLTYYLYQNGDFLRTTPGNASKIFSNGNYTVTVAAYDGQDFGSNATTNFTVDVPVADSMDLQSIVILIPFIVAAILLAVAAMLRNTDMEYFRHFLMIISLGMVVPGIGFAFAALSTQSNVSAIESNLTNYLYIIYVLDFFVVGSYVFYLVYRHVMRLRKERVMRMNYSDERSRY